MPLLVPLALACEKTGSVNLFAKENVLQKGFERRFTVLLLIIHFVKSWKTTSLFWLISRWGHVKMLLNTDTGTCSKTGTMIAKECSKTYTQITKVKKQTQKGRQTHLENIKKRMASALCLHEFLVIFSYPRESNYLSTAARFQSELAKMTYSFVPFSYHTWCTVILLTAEPRVVSFPGCHLSLAWPTYVGDHNSPPSWWLHIFHACSWLSLYQLLVALRTLGQLNDHLKVC